MKTPCNVIRDLLPLYQDSVCSPESLQLVAEHLEECETCRAEWARMRAPIPTAHPQVAVRTGAQADSSGWQRGRRRAFSKGFVIAAVLVAVISSLIGLWFLFHTPPRELTGRIVETHVNNTTGEGSYVMYTSRGEQLGLIME